MALPESAKELISSDALGHLVTIGEGGAPQVTCVWVAVDGDDLLTAHLTCKSCGSSENDPPPGQESSWHGTATIGGRPPGLLQDADRGGARGRYRPVGRLTA